MFSMKRVKIETGDKKLNKLIENETKLEVYSPYVERVKEGKDV